jgi:hypothetical protein
MSRLFLFVVVLLALPLGLKGQEPATNSPGAVVKAVATAGNQSQYSEVEQYLTSDCLAAMKRSPGQRTGGIKGWMDRATRHGTMMRMDIIEEKIQGEGAEVTYTSHYRDRSTHTDQVNLIKEKGVWKIRCG